MQNKINEKFYKIGLTKDSVKYRYTKSFVTDDTEIEEIKSFIFDDGYEAFKIEQRVKDLTSQYGIEKDECPIKGGYTEIRIRDIWGVVEKVINEGNYVFREGNTTKED